MKNVINSFKTLFEKKQLEFKHSQIISKLPKPEKDSVYIVGGGWSLRDKNVRWLADKDTICINKSLLGIPNPTYFITMDYTFFDKIKRQIKYYTKSKAKKYFVVNFANPNIQEIDDAIYDIRWGRRRYNLSQFQNIIKSYIREGIGLTLKDFRNGGNSGYCGFQLAVLLGYKKIYLLGMDFKTGRKTHWHGGYGESKGSFQKKLDWYIEFWKKGLEELKVKRPDIEVYSCSKTSKLNEIIPYKKL